MASAWDIADAVTAKLESRQMHKSAATAFLRKIFIFVPFVLVGKRGDEGDILALLVRYTRFARAIYSLRSYDILASLVRYTRFARAIYSLRSCDILASLVRYTRFARTIYFACAKCDITSICSVAILLSHAFYCLFFAVVTDEINFLLIIPHLLIRCLYVVSSMEFTLKSISNQYSVS